MNLMTIMYIAIQETVNDPLGMSSSCKALCESCDPDRREMGMRLGADELV